MYFQKLAYILGYDYSHYSVGSVSISSRKTFHFCADVSSAAILSEYLRESSSGAGGRASPLGIQRLHNLTTHPEPGLHDQTPSTLYTLYSTPQTGSLLSKHSLPSLTALFLPPMPFTLPEVPYLLIFR